MNENPVKNAVTRDLCDAKHKAIDEATRLAREIMDERLAKMNEFRDTLRDQAGKFATRDELALMMDPLRDDVRSLRETRANVEGKASQTSVIVAWVLALIGILIAIAGLVRK